MVYGKWKNTKALRKLLGDHEGEVVPRVQSYPIFNDEEKDFFGWMITTLNHMRRDDVKDNMFERTVISHRRGLSRSGRELLAQQGLLLKKSLYDSTLLTKFNGLTRKRTYASSHPAVMSHCTHKTYKFYEQTVA